MADQKELAAFCAVAALARACSMMLKDQLINDIATLATSHVIHHYLGCDGTAHDIYARCVADDSLCDETKRAMQLLCVQSQNPELVQDVRLEAMSIANEYANVNIYFAAFLYIVTWCVRTHVMRQEDAR